MDLIATVDALSLSFSLSLSLSSTPFNFFVLRHSRPFAASVSSERVIAADNNHPHASLRENVAVSGRAFMHHKVAMIFINFNLCITFRGFYRCIAFME